MENTIYQKFHSQAIARPDACAITDSDGQHTYSDLERGIDAMIGLFPTLRPRAVGIVTQHGADMIMAMLAVLKVGAAYVPAEPTLPARRIQFLMRESGVDFVLTNSRDAAKTAGLKQVMLDSPPRTGRPVATADQSVPDGTAYVLYTSGSTGMPKGVAVANSNVCNYVEAFAHELRPTADDAMLQYSVCSFDIFVEEVFCSLLNGMRLVIPSAQQWADFDRLCQLIDDERVTVISGFPYLLQEFNQRRRLPASVRLLISGGDVLRHRYIDNLIDRVEIYNTYGPSETTVCASYYRCNGATPEADGTYPIGHAVKGVSVDIRDDNLQPVPDGQVGEICIRGRGVSKGYIGDRRVENQAFVTLPDGQRLYRSGDIGYRRADGNLMFMHRKDTQVMILGRRVEPVEVENILCQVPGIAQCAVRPAFDSHNLAYLTAYVVFSPGQTPTLIQIRQQLGQFLPDFMIPEYFVQLSEMPLTPNGKVDTARLPKILKN